MVATSMRPLVEQYYNSVDGGKVDDALKLMTEDVKFTFANAAPVEGQQAVGAALQQLLDFCRRIKHDVVTFFEQDNLDGTRTALWEFQCRFDLKSGKVVDTPGAAVAIFGPDGKFIEQRIYGDLNEVFLP